MVMFCVWYGEKCTCWLVLDASSSRGNRRCLDLMEDSMDLLFLSFFPLSSASLIFLFRSSQQAILMGMQSQQHVIDFFLESIEFLCCSSLIYLLIFFLLVFNRVFRTNPNRNFRVPEMLGINFSKQISISIFLKIRISEILKYPTRIFRVTQKNAQAQS